MTCFWSKLGKLTSFYLIDSLFTKDRAIKKNCHFKSMHHLGQGSLRQVSENSMSDVQAFIIKNGYISNSVTHDRYK